MAIDRLVLATRNRKKLAEMRDLLADTGLAVVSIDDVAEGVAAVEETGTTFEANARLKALGYATVAGLLTVADDSGLEVDALDGEPGVRSSRYAGTEGDDAANNALLLERLRDVPEAERGAQFRCVIAVATPGIVHFTAEGVVRGRILTAPSGSGGFGYDPLFYFPEFDATFAEVARERKAAVSHRGQALARLKDALPGLLTILENRRDL